MLEVRSFEDRAARTVVGWQMSAFFDPQHLFPQLSPPSGHYRGQDEGEITVFLNVAICHLSHDDCRIPLV